jgi:DNA repair exonuclease SbcCD nuclease subunit
MSKVLFIGDPHLKITRFDLAKQFLVWIDQVIIDTKPDLVVNLGDTFDTHAVVRSEIMAEFMKHVDATRLICPYVYLVGNHDCFKPSDMKYHALSNMVGKFNDFIIVDKVQDLYGMTFVPYTHNSDDFPKKTLPICVAHQTFKGADYGDITTKDGVDPCSIEDASIIISGHIHKRQRIENLDRFESSTNTSGGVSVIYVGSPFSQSASDINQIKGVSLFDTETFREQFITCPLPIWKGLKYELTPSFDAEEMHEDMVQQLNNKDHWVIELTGPKAEILGYLGSKKGKSITNGRDVKIKTIFTDKEKKQMRIQASSLDLIVSEYLDKIYSGSIDRQLLKIKADELYKSMGKETDLV